MCNWNLKLYVGPPATPLDYGLKKAADVLMELSEKTKPSHRPKTVLEHFAELSKIKTRLGAKRYAFRKEVPSGWWS